MNNSSDRRIFDSKATREREKTGRTSSGPSSIGDSGVTGPNDSGNLFPSFLNPSPRLRGPRCLLPPGNAPLTLTFRGTTGRHPPPRPSRAPPRAFLRPRSPSHTCLPPPSPHRSLPIDSFGSWSSAAKDLTPKQSDPRSSRSGDNCNMLSSDVTPIVAMSLPLAGGVMALAMIAFLQLRLKAAPEGSGQQVEISRMVSAER